MENENLYTYFWLPTDLPFTVKRERDERISLLLSDIMKNEKSVISGSVSDWGDIFISKFDLCIWIQTPANVRVERLEKREFARFGKRIMPGGDMYWNHREFIEWAKTYDTADNTERSFAMHKEWKEKLTCPLLILDGTKRIDELLRELDPIIHN